MRKEYCCRILALLLLVILPHTSFADARVDARRHFHRALSLIRDGRLDEGIVEFKTAYEILPRSAVLFNIARAYYDLGEEEEALHYFYRYIDESPGTDVSEVRSLIQSLEMRIATREARERARQEMLASREEGLEDGEEESEPGGDTEEAQLTIAPQIGVEAYSETVAAAGRFAYTSLDSPTSTTIISAQDIRMSGLRSIPEIIRRAAGVDVMELTGSDHQVSIRGLNQRISNKALVMIDGRSVYLDFTGSTFWVTLPLAIEDIERIEVIRGPASAVHGADAFTGIINIVTRTPGSGEVDIGFGAGNARTGRGFARFDGGNETSRWTVSGGYEQGNHHSLPLDTDRMDVESMVKDPTMGLRRQWLRGDVDLTPKEDWDFSLGSAVFRGDYNFLAIGALREWSFKDYTFVQTYASVDSPFGLSLNVFWNALRTDNAPTWMVPGAVLSVVSDIVTDVVDVESVYKRSFKLFFDNDLALGMGYRNKYIDWAWLGDVYTEHHYSAFAENTMRPARWLQMSLGGRVDRHPLLDGLRVSPRTSVIYRPTDGHSLRAFAASAFRSPTFLESYVSYQNPTPYRGMTGVGAGNQDLLPEGIRSVELGYVNQAFEWFEFEANLYRNLVVDQIVFSRIHPYRLVDYPGYVEEVEAFPMGELQFINEDATFRQIGVDTGVRLYPVRGLNAYVNYAIHDTSVHKPFFGDDAGSDSGGEVEPLGRELDDRSSRHKINAGIAYRPVLNTEIGIDFHWSSSQVWVEQIMDPEAGMKMEAFDLPGFSLVNIRLAHRLVDNRLELALAANNIFNVKHQQHPFGQILERRFFVSMGYSY